MGQYKCLHCKSYFILLENRSPSPAYVRLSGSMQVCFLFLKQDPDQSFKKKIKGIETLNKNFLLFF